MDMIISHFIVQMHLNFCIFLYNYTFALNISQVLFGAYSQISEKKV